MEAVIAKISHWIAAIGWAAFGSAFSIFIDREKMMILSKLTILSTFIFGMIIGYVFGNAVIEYFKLAHDSFAAFASQFILGWMGIAALVEIKSQLKSGLTALRKKYLGE
jgi:hypothetical protein